MNQKPTFSGRALRAKGAATLVFDDPEWDYIFDSLLRRTQRTSLIIELTGTDIAPKTLKSIMDRKFNAIDVKPNRPRGSGKDKSCSSLLQTVHERFDASYLIGLHFGFVSDGTIETETNYKAALQKRLDVYSRYCCDLYPGSTPKLSFEYYIVLVQGVKERKVLVTTCAHCGAQHPYGIATLGKPKCPVCSLLELNQAKAHSVLQQRIGSATLHGFEKYAAI